MKVHLCYSGYLRCNLNALICGEENNKLIDVPIPYQIIEHSKGVVIVDGGCAIESMSDPVEHWGVAGNIFSLKMRDDEYVINKLFSLGYKVSDVKYVVQTHLHFDHSGALGVFPKATYIARKCELEFARNPNFIVAAAYCSKDIIKQQNNWFLLEDSRNELFDLFDDGLIRLLFTPGHTPGHQSVLLNLKRYGKLLISGDAVHQRASLDYNIIPSHGLCYSTQDYVDSIEKMRFYMNNGVKVFIGHDPKDLKNIQYLE